MTSDTLVRIYKDSSPQDKEIAVGWYRNCRGWAEEIAESLRVDPQLVIDVFTVLSPGTELAQNKLDAVQVIKHGRDYKPTTYAIGREKGYALVDGVKFDSLVNPRTSPKVWNFRANITDPDDLLPVTVDRWIAREHLGKDKLTIYQYERIAQDYRLAASELGIVPNALQALIWERARSEGKKEEVPF